MFKNKMKVTVIAMSALLVVGVSTNIFGQPGTEGDPLVTLKYVESKIEDVKRYVDNKIKSSIDEISDNSNNSDKPVKDSSNQFEIVDVKRGQKLICGKGTEIILRAGSAKAITSKQGGLSDVTEGYDLKGEEKISLNHLLLIPRDDGRGAYIENDGVFMVKGSYSIK